MQPIEPRPPLAQHVELRHAIYLYTALIVVGVAAVILLAPTIWSWAPVASGRAYDNFLTLIVFSAVAVPVFMFVMVFGFYNIFRFRTRGRPREDGPHIIASRGAQIAWIALTTAHALVLFFWGLIFLGRADAAPAPNLNQLQIDVTAEQWQFNFTYPQYGNAQTNILELPINRPVYFTITSLDVEHSFSVPALGFKEDATPGIFTHIRSTPSKIGDYSLRCFELCGILHTYMEQPVRIVSPSEFATWVHALTSHGYPWGINGAGVPNGAPPPPPGLSTPPSSLIAPAGASPPRAARTPRIFSGVV